MTSLPRGLRRLVGHGLENLDDQTEGFIDFEQRLDWTFRMVGMRERDKFQRGHDSGLVETSLGQQHDK
jgi:hypothetical protein